MLPSTPSDTLALATILVLGVSFALVPAALWPSVPKVMDKRFLGSAYSLIFWVQNIGLFGVPILFGKILAASNAEGVTDPMQYDYTNPMLMFAGFGALALIFALWLKILDSRKHYGLEKPNIIKDEAPIWRATASNNRPPFVTSHCRPTVAVPLALLQWVGFIIPTVLAPYPLAAGGPSAPERMPDSISLLM